MYRAFKGKNPRFILTDNSVSSHLSDHWTGGGRKYPKYIGYAPQLIHKTSSNYFGVQHLPFLTIHTSNELRH